MPRITLIVAPNHPYPVRERGNERQAVFRNDSESEAHDDRAATAKSRVHLRGAQDTGRVRHVVLGGKIKKGFQ